MEIAVIGHPSYLGGADTELLHQIYLWLDMGVTVHVCHTGKIDANIRPIKDDLTSKGVIYHDSEDWKSLQDLHCISYCNGHFLENLPIIKQYAKSTTFVNCMTWAFDKEVEMTKRGLIDLHLYQTVHGYQKIAPKLLCDHYNPMIVKPYFHTESFPFHNPKKHDTFRFGRISRCDAEKFHPSQLNIYETMVAPLPKSGIIVGWGQNAWNVYGTMPPDYIKLYAEGMLKQSEFYSSCDAIIMSTKTFENLPRVGFEAMSSGCVLVVDKRGGWEQEVQNGITGWLCSHERDMIYKSSRLAFEFNERVDMANKAREYLEQNWGKEITSKYWEAVFTELEKI